MNKKYANLNRHHAGILFVTHIAGRQWTFVGQTMFLMLGHRIHLTLGQLQFAYRLESDQLAGLLLGQCNRQQWTKVGQLYSFNVSSLPISSSPSFWHTLPFDTVLTVFCLWNQPLLCFFRTLSKIVVFDIQMHMLFFSVKKKHTLRLDL